MKRFLSLAIVLIAAALPSTSFAYSYIFSCGPSWSNLPVQYWINSAGSGDIPLGTVESIVEDSFAVWGEPCCSRFAASYQGTTQLTAPPPSNNGRVVLSWTEQNWNPNWGSVNVTIGITFSQVYNNCTIAEAPILFNGVGFRFTTNGGGTDLQSIATHEIGHLIGLGHSQLQDATMYSRYIGGTSARSLHQDDVDGACSLYTRSCSCVSNADCGAQEVCSNRQCIPRPCTSNAECASGLECNVQTGECRIPPCATDADCAQGFICNQRNICVSECPVCRKNCDDNGDCGANGFCVADGEGGTVCIVTCGQNAECPGDSQCYSLDDGQGGTIYACGSPDATTSLCEGDYVCETERITDECASDADCPGGEACIGTTMGRRCQAPADPCANVDCDSGESCVEGTCVPDSTNNQPGTNNDPGANNGANNAPGTNNGANDGTGSGGATNSDDDDDFFIIIRRETDEPEDDTVCSMTPSRSLPGSFLLFALAVAVSRRRGKKQ